jgi:hypothetical protein
MKKSILYNVMTLAMMAAMCMTFTACGGDDDDTSKKPESGWILYDPFLTLNASPDEVKEYMMKKYPQFSVEAPFGNNNGYSLIYYNEKKDASIVYGFILNKLSTIGMEYFQFSKAKYDFLCSELKKHYSTEVLAETDEGKMFKAVINGQNYLIAIGYGKNSVINENSITITFTNYPID